MPTSSSRPLNAEERQRFFEALREENPRPAGELEYTSAYELLIAVMLSAQATDVSVNKATRRLFLVASSAHEMAQLDVATIEALIKTIGLYRTKAKNVLTTSRLLLERYQGQVPMTREHLESLPGVGRKTANVVLNMIMGEATVAVDTHVFRVANRTGLAPGRDVLKVEHALLSRVPGEFMVDCHHWLILHGRYICKARLPECWRCGVAAICHFPDKTTAPRSAQTSGE